MIVLIATLDNLNIEEQIKTMNLYNIETIIVNQSSLKKESNRVERVHNTTILHSDRIGLSASRNDAISLAPNDSICQIADDDMIFVDNYAAIVDEAYKAHPDADMIVFYLHREDSLARKGKLPSGKIGYLRALNVSSGQITFKKSSLEKNGIKFDERFGIGAKYGFGEENILLFDCLRKHLNIYSYPVEIAHELHRESHWDRTNNKEQCRKRGAVYRRMSPKLFWLFILQYAVRKRNIMPEDISIFKNIKYMYEGVREFNKE